MTRTTSVRQSNRSRRCVIVCGNITSAACGCEIEVGIHDSAHIGSYRRQLRHLTQKVKLVPLELAIVQEYGRIYRELRQMGLVMSQVDMLLAAMIRQMNGFS